jgi:uncharacterized protein (UPF0332 family)
MFDPKDFLGFSDTILASHSTEATYRSAISRSYYAVFLKLREKLRAKFPSLIVGLGKDHSTVLNALKEAHYFNIACKYNELREERGKADYDLNVIFLERQANEVLKDAKDLIENDLPSILF